jgi:flagellar protein FlbT
MAEAGAAKQARAGNAMSAVSHGRFNGLHSPPRTGRRRIAGGPTEEPDERPMPLSIPLPAHTKLIINGAVIENGGPGNITLTVHNKANILRDKDVITQTEATTPAREIYHTIQNAYLFEANKEEWLALSLPLLDRFLHAWPDSAPIVAHVRQLLAEDKIYNALRASRRLIALETGEPSAPATPAEPRPPKPAGRTQEIARIKGQIADLERRIEALDHE